MNRSQALVPCGDLSPDTGLTELGRFGQARPAPFLGGV